jgi:glycosyltransferase involved in cell wall biosynthesis
MIIAVNTRLLLQNKLEGIGRFTDETLKIITRKHPEHSFVFIFDREFSDEFIYSANITPVICHPPARHPVLWYFFFEWGIPAVLRKFKADMFLSPDGWLSLRTPVRSIPVIHDLNFFQFPEFIPGHVRAYYQHYFPRFVGKAYRIATVSSFSRQDIAARFAYDMEKIDVVFNGASDGFKPLDTGSQEKVRGIFSRGCPYFLSIGLIHPRKNIGSLITAFGEFKESVSCDTKLLIVGSRKWWTRDMQHALDSSGCPDEILFTGRVNDDDLQKITASALALVYVSYFEGFGIPVLEAMHCETPVIASEVTSLPEVGGDAVLFVDPCSVESIKNAMVRMHHDGVLRQDLIIKARLQREKFSWEKTADLLWNCVEKGLLPPLATTVSTASKITTAASFP